MHSIHEAVTTGSHRSFDNNTLSSVSSQSELPQTREIILVDRLVLPLVAEVNRAAEVPWIGKFIETFFIGCQIHFLGATLFLPGAFQGSIGWQRKKSIRRRMNYTSEDVTEEEKAELIRNLQILGEDGAVMCLQIGLEYGCDMFIDWELQSYLIREFPESSIIIAYLAWYTAFFPAENHKLRSQVTMAGKLSSIPAELASMFYQLHRVYVFRQSSASREANVDFAKVRKITEQLVTLYSNFWRDIANPSVEIDISRYDGMTKVRLIADALWSEMLEKYPNNPRFAHEYSRYLLEARCDFKKAIRWHVKAAALEHGQRLSDDKLFQRFRATFPFYLKKQIVGPAGQLRPRMAGRRDTWSSSDSSGGLDSGPSDNSEGDMTKEAMDKVDREAFLPGSQQKLSLQRAIRSYRSANISRIQISVLVRAVVTLLFCCLVFVYIAKLFHARDLLLYVVSRFANLGEYLAILPQQITWWWAMYYSDDLQMVSEVIGKVGSSVYLIDTFMQLNANLQGIVKDLAFAGIDCINEMSYDLYNQKLDDWPLLERFAMYMSNSSAKNMVVGIDMTPLIWVVNDSVTTPDYVIRDFLNMGAVLSLDAEASDRMKWYNSYLCATFILRHWDVIDVMSKAVAALSPFYEKEYMSYLETGSSPYLFEANKSVPGSFEVSYAESISKETELELVPLLVIALTPFVVVFLIYHPVIYLSVGTKLEVEKLTSVLRQFPMSDCETAARRINNPHAFERAPENEEGVLQNQATLVPVWIPSFVSAGFIIFFIILMAQLAISSGRQMDFIMQHFMLTMELQNLVTGIASDAILSVFVRMCKNDLFNQLTVDTFGEILTNEPLWLTVEEVLQHLDEEVTRAKMVYNMLNYGGTSVPPLSKSSDLITQIFFDAVCPRIQAIQRASDYYRCVSFDVVINYIIERALEVKMAPDDFFMNSSEILDIGFLIDSRLATGFTDLYKGYVALYEKERTEFISVSWVLFVLTVIACLLSSAFDYFSIDRIESINDTFRDVVLRIDPAAFVRNEKAMLFILKKTSHLDTRIVSGAHAMFELSGEAVITISQDGVIESLNPAVQKMFGYSPEQVLGQHIEMLLSVESNESHIVPNTLEAMRTGASELKHVCDLNGRKDDGTEFPLAATILGFVGSGKIVNSFAIVCKDITTSEEAKLVIEQLENDINDLYIHVLPHELVERIQSKTATSFRVPCATVAVLGIDEFLPYADTLTATQLLKNMSAIFNYYDNIIEKYPLLSKIRIAAGTYTVVGGFFSSVSDPTFHAEQAVNFCIDCLELFEDVNVQLNANLFLRIGIQTGGPVTGGLVGGIGNPSFQLIGEPLDTAEMLLGTGHPGAIHICEDALAYIPKEQLTISQHDEISLPSGRKMTYLINSRLEKNRARVRVSISGQHPLLTKPNDRQRRRSSIRSSDEIAACRGSPSLPEFVLLKDTDGELDGLLEPGETSAEEKTVPKSVSYYTPNSGAGEYTPMATGVVVPRRRRSNVEKLRQKPVVSQKVAVDEGSGTTAKRGSEKKPGRRIKGSRSARGPLEFQQNAEQEEQERIFDEASGEPVLDSSSRKEEQDKEKVKSAREMADGRGTGQSKEPTEKEDLGKTSSKKEGPRKASDLVNEEPRQESSRKEDPQKITPKKDEPMKAPSPKKKEEGQPVGTKKESPLSLGDLMSGQSPAKKEEPQPTSPKKETPMSLNDLMKGSSPKKEEPQPASPKKETPLSLNDLMSSPSPAKKEEPQPTSPKKETPMSLNDLMKGPSPKKESPLSLGDLMSETVPKKEEPQQTSPKSGTPLSLNDLMGSSPKKEEPQPTSPKKETPMSVNDLMKGRSPPKKEEQPRAVPKKEESQQTAPKKETPLSLNDLMSNPAPKKDEPPRTVAKTQEPQQTAPKNGTPLSLNDLMTGPSPKKEQPQPASSKKESPMSLNDLMKGPSPPKKDESARVVSTKEQIQEPWPALNLNDLMGSSPKKEEPQQTSPKNGAPISPNDLMSGPSPAKKEEPQQTSPKKESPLSLNDLMGSSPKREEHQPASPKKETPMSLNDLMKGPSPPKKEEPQPASPKKQSPMSLNDLMKGPSPKKENPLSLGDLMNSPAPKKEEPQQTSPKSGTPLSLNDLMSGPSPSKKEEPQPTSPKKETPMNLNDLMKGPSPPKKEEPQQLSQNSPLTLNDLMTKDTEPSKQSDATNGLPHTFSIPSLPSDEPPAKISNARSKPTLVKFAEPVHVQRNDPKPDTGIGMARWVDSDTDTELEEEVAISTKATYGPSTGANLEDWHHSQRPLIRFDDSTTDFSLQSQSDSRPDSGDHSQGSTKTRSGNLMTIPPEASDKVRHAQSQAALDDTNQ